MEKKNHSSILKRENRKSSADTAVPLLGVAEKAKEKQKNHINHKKKITKFTKSMFVVVVIFFTPSTLSDPSYVSCLLTSPLVVSPMA